MLTIRPAKTTHWILLFSIWCVNHLVRSSSFVRRSFNTFSDARSQFSFRFVFFFVRCEIGFRKDEMRYSNDGKKEGFWKKTIHIADIYGIRWEFFLFFLLFSFIMYSSASLLNLHLCPLHLQSTHSGVSFSFLAMSINNRFADFVWCSESQRRPKKKILCAFYYVFFISSLNSKLIRNAIIWVRRNIVNRVVALADSSSSIYILIERQHSNKLVAGLAMFSALPSHDARTLQIFHKYMLISDQWSNFQIFQLQ